MFSLVKFIVVLQSQEQMALYKHNKDRILPKRLTNRRQISPNLYHNFLLDIMIITMALNPVHRSCQHLVVL